MKESIYTIPIHEAFEPMEGCPLCAIRRTLELRWVEYITGPAMMEPDVRIETNRSGFCARHFEQMLEGANRLPVALMLQSRLEYLGENLTKEPKKGLFAAKNTQAEADGCFVCSRVERETARVAGNAAALWAREEEFRALYGRQETLCLPHYRVMANAATSLRGSDRTGFLEASATLTRKELSAVAADIDAFVNLFDYRSAGAGRPSDEVSGAVEAAISYLIGGDSR